LFLLAYLRKKITGKPFFKKENHARGEESTSVRNGREVLWRERKRNASATGAALHGADVGNVHTGRDRVWAAVLGCLGPRFRALVLQSVERVGRLSREHRSFPTVGMQVRASSRAPRAHGIIWD